MLNYLAFIGSLMHCEQISTLILEKLLCLLHDCNQFYEEGYMKFSVYKKRSKF